MAISATISVSNSCVLAGQPVNVALTISNSGANPVTLQGVQTLISKGQASWTGTAPLGPNAPTSIPAGGTLNVSWSEVFYGGLQSVSPEWPYSVGAVVYTGDGAVTAASPQAIVQVIPQQSPSTSTTGNAVYTPTPGPLAATSANAPLPGQSPLPPVGGQLRFESNLNSALVVPFF